MKRNLICKTFVIGAAALFRWLLPKSGDKLPAVRAWWVGMIRCPESWQLDFQPKLEMGLLSRLGTRSNARDVYDTYGGKRYMIMHWLMPIQWFMMMVVSLWLTNYTNTILTDLNSGNSVPYLWGIQDEKYKKAIDLLRSQLDTHPRNEDGGFWHKKIYPNQMWLDGIYMASPFMRICFP